MALRSQHDPIASCDDLARCHKRFVQFVHDTELQILHVSIPESECGSLQSKLSNLLSFCSNVLLALEVGGLFNS